LEEEDFEVEDLEVDDKLNEFGLPRGAITMDRNESKTSGVARVVEAPEGGIGKNSKTEPVASKWKGYLERIQRKWFVK